MCHPRALKNSPLDMMRTSLLSLLTTLACVSSVASSSSINVMSKEAALSLASSSSDILSSSSSRRLQPSYDELTPFQPLLESVYSRPGSPPWSTFHYFALNVNKYPAVVAAGGFRLIVSNLDENKDVDVFVSFEAFPTVQAHDFAGISAWAEILDINGANFKSTCGTPTCYYYIGVSPYTFGQHFFSILLVPFGAVMPLADGEPIDGSQIAGTTGYYTFPFLSNVRMLYPSPFNFAYHCRQHELE